MRLSILLSSLLFFDALSRSLAWTTARHNMRSQQQTQRLCAAAVDDDDDNNNNNNNNNHSSSSTLGRRQFFSTAAAVIAPLLLIPPQPVHAAAATEKVNFANLSVADAQQRFQRARQDVAFLIANYESIASKGGGDAIRNQLGTQGVNSNVFGIQKVLTILRDEADDIVEYSELVEEFNAYYYQADGAAYQSMFAEHSSAKVTGAELLVTAKKDIVAMSKYMDQLAAQLHL